MAFEYEIREIIREDNKKIEQVIRTCLIEFGANHEGTAWADPDLCRFSEIYNKKGHKYWVATQNGEVVAGVGIGALQGEAGVCELQKMYCLKEHRGHGIAGRLMKIALAYAAQHYNAVYLETLPNMHSAQKLYEAFGFVRTAPLGSTGHFNCDVCYIKTGLN